MQFRKKLVMTTRALADDYGLTAVFNLKQLHQLAVFKTFKFLFQNLK